MSQTVTPGQLQQWLFDGQEIALFDVREHGQYGEAHLFFGVNLPYSRLELEVRRQPTHFQLQTAIGQVHPEKQMGFAILAVLTHIKQGDFLPVEQPLLQLLGS